MASPEAIQISWGGNWKNYQKRKVRPTIEAALDLANLGLKEIGLEAGTKPSRAILTRCGLDYRLCGEVVGRRSFRIFMPHQWVKRKGVGDLTSLFAVTATHEMVHCLRYGFFAIDNLLETIASEGLAYMAESVFAEMLLPPNEYASVANEVLELPESKIQEMGRLLLSEGQQHPLCDHAFDSWLESDSSTPEGILYGVSRVADHIKQGARLDELIRLPYEELLFSGVK